MMAQALAARWNALAPREQLLVAVAAVVVGCALLWSVAVGPALATLRAAQVQHRQLDAQLQRMQGLRAQALAMQSQPRLGQDEAMRQLEEAIRAQFGAAARYSIAGERVTITLSGVAAQAIAQWLAQARINARALPGEARLVRNAAGTWDGTLVLTLPPR